VALLGCLYYTAVFLFKLSTIIMVGAVKLTLPLPALDRSVDWAVMVRLEQHEMYKAASEYATQSMFYETVICVILQS